MRFLLDENVEHEVYHRLMNYGHNVVHVDISDGLNKGDADFDLADCSLRETRVIVTYDDDFRDNFTGEEFHAVLYFDDQTLSARKVADVLDEISTYFDTERLTKFRPVGRSWLE